ncbi:MAG TPA: GNAT family N-acetyltransferase [Bacteroidia bacterium]|jgi:GNAT superfamily N-acetyltransferase|nr:GNAT family N-acetyltransferase [Bacteroidia bacterium]
MATKTEIAYLQDDDELFSSIAEMYYNEWKIDKSLTIDWLKKRTSRKVPFVLVAYRDQKPVGVAGLSDEVNLFAAHPKYKKYAPWLSLLYVKPEYRNKDIGSLLCNSIEAEAFRMGISRIYLYTESARLLYEKLGWKEMERVIYKGQETVLMYKDM